MFTVYGMSDSGNCYKVRLALEQLALPYRWVETDTGRGDTRTPEFLAMNPNGKVPTLRLEDGGFLPESNAILHYLADGSRLLPTGRVDRARVLQWMFFEQYSHEPYIAVARFICGWTPLDSPRRADLPKLRERGFQAIAVMEKHLAAEAWFGGADYGIADIALFAYTHCAGDGGFDLAAFPRVRGWLERVRMQPGFVAMPPYAAENSRLIERSRAAGAAV
ncbi:MAG TPA: glutathione S-transferase family protein [Rudaea sp.]